MFEFTTCVMVIYDCVMIPFNIAYAQELNYNPTVKFTLDCIQLIINIFFITDIVIGFRKAYLNKQTGHEVRDPKLIAIKYLKSHFIIDFLSGIPYDFFT